jgi:hypothetical protein
MAFSLIHPYRCLAVLASSQGSKRVTCEQQYVGAFEGQDCSNWQRSGPKSCNRVPPGRTYDLLERCLPAKAGWQTPERIKWTGLISGSRRNHQVYRLVLRVDSVRLLAKG